MKNPTISRIAMAGLVLAAVIGMQGCMAPHPSTCPPSTRVDPAQARADEKADLRWYDAQQLQIEGKGWTDTEDFYDRLPARAKGVVPDAVWGLSKNSAGLCVRFVTDATTISARWSLTSSRLSMPHMTALGVGGVDLYVYDDGEWKRIGPGRTQVAVENQTVLAAGVEPCPREYLLYLPLYNGVKSVEIGIPAKAGMYLPAPRTDKPICVYGTSIVQGGCASRTGMAHVAILGRRLNRPTINLGFSGNGKMELSLAKTLAELDVAVYVLDCLPNMIPDMVAERVEPFVIALHEARPHTPIVLVESAVPPPLSNMPKRGELTRAKNAALQCAYEKLIARGIRNLSYVRGETLLGNDGEGAVDGCHPTDLGFTRMADALEPTLRKTFAR